MILESRVVGLARECDRLSKPRIIGQLRGTRVKSINGTGNLCGLDT